MQQAYVTGIPKWLPGRIRLRHKLVPKVREQQCRPPKVEATQPAELESVDPAPRYSDGTGQLRLAQSRGDA
jgi:hypothetical protein